MTSQIIFDVHFEAAPGREKELEQALLTVREGSRGEAGCLTYELNRDPEHPGKFLLYEKFRDRDAHAAHLAAPHFLTFQKFCKENQDVFVATTVTSWRSVE
jgi:quinol monooxygenase YgiN